MVATTSDETAVPYWADCSTHRSTNRQTANYPANLKRLIRTLKTISPLTPTQISEVVREVDLTAQDLLPWADFTHPCTDSYGRKLVFHGGHFEIMVMSWLPGDFSAIHDHGSTQWGAVQCFGAAEHTIYSLVKGVLKNPVAANYTPGMVREVDHHLIHQMGNRGKQPFLSLHVYGCEQKMASITANARVFDLLEGTIQYTDGGVFFCLPEDKINKRDYGLSGDKETTMRQYRLMRDRLQQALLEDDNIVFAQKLTQLKNKICTLSQPGCITPSVKLSSRQSTRQKSSQ